MVQPIGQRSTPLIWHTEPIMAQESALAPSHGEIKKAQSHVASLNFKYDTIESLAPQKEVPKKADAVEAGNEKKSFLGRIGDWFWGLLGYDTKQAPANSAGSSGSSTSSSASSSANNVSKAQQTEGVDKKKLEQTILNLNRELTQRMKESAEFEEELRKAGTNQLDHLYFVHLVKFSLDHKGNKEIGSTLIHEDLMSLHEKNKKLHTIFYNLKEEIATRAKTNDILKWVNIGTTGAIVGCVALTFATGGLMGVWSFALPLLSLGKGSLTIAQGGLNYKNDLDTGELSMVSHQTRTNSAHIEEDMEIMQLNDGDIKAIMEGIRSHLESKSETTHLFTQQYA